jgi:hypothetical protein
LDRESSLACRFAALERPVPLSKNLLRQMIASRLKERELCGRKA